MTQYRKKPVTIEAVRFDGLNPTEIKDFVGENCKVKIYDNEVTTPVARIVIHTLEGDMKVSKGDYVIKGVKGEFYPCKPDIFEQTYESVETRKELDEAAREYAKTTFKKPYSDNPDEEVTIVEPDKYAGFIAGAKWDREQMMSEAVEGEVVLNPFPTIFLDDCEDYDFKDNDKVHIIIVKEDSHD